MGSWSALLSMLIAVASYLHVYGTGMPIVENITLAHADFQLSVEWDPPSEVVDINSTLFYAFYARSKYSSFTLNTTTTNILFPYHNLKGVTKWNFTVIANVDGLVVAKGSKNFQLQRIDNISLTNVDFEYLLRWQPVTVSDEKIRKAVWYNVSAEVAIGPPINYYHYTTTNTIVTISPLLGDDQMIWTLVITATIDGHLIGISETKRYYTLVLVPKYFSAPLLNLSNDCGNTTVHVSLRRRFDDMIMRLPKFKVEYFYDSSTTPFRTMSKYAEYDATGSINWTFTVQAARAHRVCVVAKYAISYGINDSVSDGSRMCAAPQCQEGPQSKDDPLLKNGLPIYFNVLIGVAIVAAVIMLTLLIYNLKKYVWNPWKGKVIELPLTTQHVIEYHPDDHAFSRDWHQGELLSKVESSEVTNLVNLETETPLCSCNEREISLELVACELPRKTDCMTRNAGDHHIENPMYEKTSGISSEKKESFFSVKTDRKGSVDSAFSEYIALQACQSTVIITPPPSDIPTFSDTDEGYVRFPGENR